jgi:hypothetical protein
MTNGRAYPDMSSYIIDQNIARKNIYDPMTLGVGHHGAGEFNIHSVYVWDEMLSKEDMLAVTRGLRSELGGTPDFSNQPVSKISDLHAYYLS